MIKNAQRKPEKSEKEKKLQNKEQVQQKIVRQMVAINPTIFIITWYMNSSSAPRERHKVATKIKNKLYTVYKKPTLIRKTQTG